MPRRPIPSVSAQVVFSANFVAVVTAAVFRWRLSDLLMLYWLELIALGAVAIFQMRHARAAGTFQKSRGYVLIQFLAHYGTFCVVYRAVLMSLFGASTPPADWFWALVWLPLAALVIAHGLSFRRDFLPNEARNVSPFDAMWIPYLRELPVHVPLLAAIALIQPDPAARTVVLGAAGAKTALDVAAHLYYHTRLARTSPRA